MMKEVETHRENSWGEYKYNGIGVSKTEHWL